jgi:hypothetical protein
MQYLAGLGKGALAAVGVGYFAAVNVAAVGLFWYDKQQALRHSWRVRLLVVPPMAHCSPNVAGSGSHLAIISPCWWLDRWNVGDG